MVRDKDVIKTELTAVRAAHAHLVQHPSDREAFGLARDNERRDALGAFVRFGLGVHDEMIGLGSLEGDRPMSEEPDSRRMV